MHWTVGIVLLRSCLLQGQEALAQQRFAVVSIKPTVAIINGKTFRLTPNGGFRAGNYSLKDLIRLGWDVRNFQISGGPGWLDTDRYNVEAKPETPFDASSTAGFKRLGDMVQLALEDRFRLKVHQQTKEMSVYYLVVGTVGPKLKRTGDATDISTQMRDSEGHMWATKFDMPLLAKYLGGELERAVVVVEQGVDHCDEGVFRQLLLDEVAVEPLEHLVGRHQPVLTAEHLLRLHPLLDEDRQQARRHPVPHRVGDVEADVLLVQPEDVVEVAADPAAQAIMHRESALRDLWQ